MTVAELIEELRLHDQGAEVHFAYNYGDHWRTVVAPEVTEVEQAHITHSAYHQMDKLVEEPDEVDPHDRSVTQVVLLRA